MVVTRGRREPGRLRNRAVFRYSPNPRRRPRLVTHTDAFGAPAAPALLWHSNSLGGARPLGKPRHAQRPRRRSTASAMRGFSFASGRGAAALNPSINVVVSPGIKNRSSRRRRRQTSKSRSALVRASLNAHGAIAPPKRRGAARSKERPRRPPPSARGRRTSRGGLGSNCPTSTAGQVLIKASSPQVAVLRHARDEIREPRRHFSVTGKKGPDDASVASEKTSLGLAHQTSLRGALDSLINATRDEVPRTSRTVY